MVPLRSSLSRTRGSSTVPRRVAPLALSAVAGLRAERRTARHAPAMAASDCEAAATATDPPPFDAAQFDRVMQLQALRVAKSGVNELCVVLRRLGALLDLPRRPSVIPAADAPEQRLVLLHESVQSTDLHELSDAARSAVAERSLVPEPYALPLTYEYFTADHVLKALLPAGSEVPGSFETVGHIAHLNLRDELLPFKRVIGRVLLDKNAPKIKTILNKVGTIESEFRVPSFEVLAGDSCLETEVRQHGAVFRLDYGEVYWNSRLEHEHKRLVELFRPGEVVCDMMAGIGPFAVPAGRRRVTVHANDLNPRCAHYLRLNARLNKVEERVNVYNMDARAFVRALAGGDASPAGTEPAVPVLPGGFDHIVMNLPASAIQFLDALAGAFTAPHWEVRSLPLVHCYAFLRDSETEADIRKQVEAALGGELPDGLQMLVVRNVAPRKEMICVTFRVPEFCRRSAAADTHRASKRAKPNAAGDDGAPQ